ncbi:MAG: hypothetical protein LW923_06075, partial [Betaproteobacteria bacterium]|nr:hypothetical protein [Betaproteobacteria bacterium]
MTARTVDPDGLEPLLQRVADGLPGLLADFNAICDCGGRVAGSDSERRARDLTLGRLAEIAGAGRAWLEPVDYAGWQPGSCSLSLADGTPLACQPLLGSASTPPAGLMASVIDLGRGTDEDFQRAAARIPGR